MKKLNLLQKATAIGMTLILALGATASAAAPSTGTPINNVGGSDSVQNIAIATMYNNLTKQSSTKLLCEGSTTVRSGYYAEVVVELQQYKNSEWNTIQTWSDTDSYVADVYEICTVASGYSYRLKLTHTAYNSNWGVVESFTKWSKGVS